jgi:hypothetical protein
MKFAALLAFCFVPLLMPAQEHAPTSVSDMIYTATRPMPPLGSFTVYAAILSAKGIYTPFDFTSSSKPQPGPYAWTKTGVNTGTLVLSGEPFPSRHELVFTGNGRGTYRETVVATGAVIAGDFLLAAMPNGPPSPLANFSVRTSLAGGRLALLGFVVEGQTSRRVLVRAVGPSLAPFGVVNPAASPALTVLRGAAQIGANTGWGGASDVAAIFREAGAFALPTSSRDSAVLLTLEPGNYTAQARDANGGEVLLEVYVLN